MILSDVSDKASLKEHSNFFTGIVQYIPLPYIRNTKLVSMKSNFNRNDDHHEDEITLNELKRGGRKLKETRVKNILHHTQLKWLLYKN